MTDAPSCSTGMNRRAPTLPCVRTVPALPFPGEKRFAASGRLPLDWRASVLRQLSYTLGITNNAAYFTRTVFTAPVF